jgi:hypothetical protein
MGSLRFAAVHMMAKLVDSKADRWARNTSCYTEDNHRADRKDLTDTTIDVLDAPALGDGFISQQKPLLPKLFEFHAGV